MEKVGNDVILVQCTFNPHRAFACMRWRGSMGDDHEISSYLHSKRYQNINLDQIKNRDINLMISYLIFYQNCKFLAIHVDARSWNGDFLLSSVECSRCAAKWQTRFGKLLIKQIGGFTKSLSEYGCVWTRNAYFLKLIPNTNLKISISKIFEHFIFFLNPYRAFACMRWRGSRGDDHEISSFLHSKRYQNINLD